MFISLWELRVKVATKAAAVEITVETIVKATVELLWRLLLGLFFLFPPILAVNTYSKVEAVRIKGVFRNRPNTIITSIK